MRCAAASAGSALAGALAVQHLAAERLRAAGSKLWMTVTSVPEARAAMAFAPDALIGQGVEAGGHRGVFADEEGAPELTLLSALQLIRAAVDAPQLAERARAEGVLVSVVGPQRVRLVTHLDVDDAGVRRAAEVVARLL